MARSRALYEGAWRSFLARSGASESEVRASLTKADTVASSLMDRNSSARSPTLSDESRFQTPSTRIAANPDVATQTVDGLSASNQPEDIGPSNQNIGIPGPSDNGFSDVAPRGWDRADAGIYGHPEPGTDLGPFLPQRDVPLGAQAQDYVLGRGRVTGNEHLVAIDKDGSVSAHIEGSPRSVAVPPELNKQFYDPSKAIAVHHNHPSNSTLSDRDIAMLALPGIHSIWAHGHEGKVSRAALTPFGRAMMSGHGPRDVAQLGRLREMLADRAFVPPLTEPVKAGAIDPFRADDLLGYLSNEALRRAGMMDYQTNDHFENEIKQFGLQPHLDAAVATLRANYHGFTRTIQGPDRAAPPGDDRSTGALFRHPGELGTVFERPQGVPGRYDRPRPPDRTRGAQSRAEAARQLELSLAEGRKQTKTLAFKAWFGDSKVVNKDGSPKVVYHGTDAPEDFNTFEHTEDIGFHFGSAAVANARAAASGPVVEETARNGGPLEHQANRRVIPVYLSIKNPLRLPDMGTWEANDVLDALEEEGILPIPTPEEAHPGFGYNDDVLVDREFVAKALAKHGYDGIVYLNRGEGVGNVDVSDIPLELGADDAFKKRVTSAEDSYIAFHPEQIKSATGNRGTFDPTLGNMLADTTGPFSRAKTAAGGAGGGKKPPPGTKTAAPGAQPNRGAILNAVTGNNLAKTFKNFWTSKFQPELVSARAFAADPLFARYKAAGQQEKVSLVKKTEDDWSYWNKQPDTARVRFLDDIETAGFGNVPPDPKEAVMAQRYKRMLEENYQEEKKYGSKAGYREDYFPHIWESPDEWTSFSQARAAQVGPTWFQKERTIDYITDGLAHGLKLKYTNPVDILNHRLMSGVDMRQRMELLHKLRDMQLAYEGEKGGEQMVKRGWRLINAPDRKQWIIAPDVQPLWQNAVEARSLWDREGLGGGAFRAWMAVKSAWVPVKLALSAFHPLHVLHIDQAQSLGLAFDLVTKNRDLPAAAKAAGEAVATIPTLGMIHYRRGRSAIQAWEKPLKDQTPIERYQTSIMRAAGYSPLPSEEMQIRAKRQLAEAFAKIQRGEAGVSDWRKAVSGAMRRPIEMIQNPIFGKWIPALKTAALLNQAAAWLARHPGADTAETGIALRAIGKSIDNRYGEMNYSTLFWDRAIQDSAKAAMLSLGWNLGFVREFGGAAMESVTRPLGMLPGSPFKPTPERAIAREASNKIPFVLGYIATAAASMA